MRPLVVTAVLLLVDLMSMSASADWTPELMCQTRYPENYCRKDLFEGGWHQFGPNRCVKAFHNVYLGHRDAKQACWKYPRGDLVSIHNVVDLEYVQCAMYRTTPEKAHYWIGMYRESNRLVWTDGTPHDYSNWAGGEPNNAWGLEHCIEMNYWSWGLWNDDKCHYGKPYVCSVKI